MSKKKIIAGIMGTTTLITGDGAISTVAPTISEKGEKNEEKKSEYWKQKKGTSKIRRKRENEQHVTFLNSINNYDNYDNFVEKIHNYDKSLYEISLFLTKEKSIKILSLFLLNDKDIFIIETKNIITKIKNNSINLSAKAFDENAIDAFAHQIWKNFPKFCDLVPNLGINQNIQIKSNITNIYWGEFKFQVIGKKSEWEKNESLKPFNFENYKRGRTEYVKKIIDNELEKTKNKLIRNNYNQNKYFIEKIYNDDNACKASFILSNNIGFDIIDLFIRNNKNNFILKIKQKITEIKNNSINLSAKAFDENAIDAFAHQIWKNFPKFCDLVPNLGINQNIQIKSNITNIYWGEFKFQVIGKKSEWEKKEEKQKNSIKKSNIDKCNNNLIKPGTGNVVEKWYNNIIKIKFNKITWAKINILFFMLKNKSDIIEQLIELFSSFSFTSRGSYPLNIEDIKSFAYLIWQNFGYYYDCFQKLEKNEFIRISSKSGHPEGYWTSDHFYDNNHNEIVDKNNDVIDWQIFNNRQIKSTTHKEKVWTSKDDELKRKKRPKSNKIELNDIIFKRVLDKLPNFKIINIFGRFLELNPNLDLDEIEIISIAKNYILISAKKDSTKYNGKVVIKLETQKKEKLLTRNNQYDVPGDNNCLFWTVATSYLLPVRNNYAEFKNRFIRLFGEENLEHLSYIQIFMNNFDINNKTSNQIWYRNPVSNLLITNVFRNRVVDYIRNNRQMFELDITHNEFHNNSFEGYLTDMRKQTSWGGGIEIQAMTYLLNLQIFVNDIRIRQENIEDFIQIFHVNQNHYNFSLPTISTINTANSEVPKTNLFSDTSIRNIAIDLRPQMPIPMEYQEDKTWCCIATIKNVMDNALIKDEKLTLSQKQLADLFSKAGFNVDNEGYNEGICSISVHKFLNENNFIQRNLGYYYSDVDLRSELFTSVLNNVEKLILTQNLIWESLSRGTPIFLSINADPSSPKNVDGHSVLIVGIIPNEDPFETLYFVRNPSPRASLGSIDPNDAPNTETSMTGQEIYESLFSSEYFAGYMSINSNVLSMNLIPEVIHHFLHYWNFQNLLGIPRNYFLNPNALNFSGDLISLSSISPTQLSQLINQELCEFDNDDIDFDSTSESK